MPEQQEPTPLSVDSQPSATQADSIETASTQKSPSPTQKGLTGWNNPLWYIAFFSMRMLPNLADNVKDSNTGMALADMVVPLALFTLVAVVDVITLSHTKTLRLWHWLKFVPALFVLVIGFLTFEQDSKSHPVAAISWVTVTPAGENCSVTMPGEPSVAPPTGTGTDGENRLNYQYKTDAEAYNVIHFEYPAGTFDRSSIEAEERRVVGALASAMGGSPGGEHDEKLDGRTAVEFTMDSTDKNATVVSRLCIVGEILYVTGYTTHLHETNETNKQRFFNSFHVLAK